MDCTDNSQRRPVSRALIGIVILVLATGWFASQAQADGDPASDVLAAQALFLPQDASASTQQQLQLVALLAAAQRHGYRIRVALIASPTDLGSVTELWRQPQTYAHFLGQELSAVYRGTLLVVMPNGYGLYGVGRAPPTPSAIRGLATPAPSLATAAISAIRHLAAASGHTLPLAPQVSASTASPSSAIPWIVFGIGAALILIAWSVSLRAKPLRAGIRRTTAD